MYTSQVRVMRKALQKSTCRRGGMADAPDSKSGDGNIVWVQVPLPAFVKPLIFYIRGFFT